MSASNLRRELEQARATIRLLQDELHETNRGLLVLAVELEKRVEARTVELRLTQEELEKTNSELLHLTLELEDRVAERTGQLRSKNEEVKTMTQQLWHSAKLATMGELAASIAHELNNPLATVSLRIESLLELCSPVDPQHHTLLIIQQEVERMASLIANLLQFSRRGTSHVSTLNLADEIEKTLELIQYLLRDHNIQVVQELASNDLFISADRQKLRQLFLNLFTNASDAMPQGGTLTIRGMITQAAPSSAAADPPTIALPMAVIEIADTGIGIAAENLPRLGKAFFTTKPVGKGTGLGLAICQRIVQEHKGSLDILSEVNHGTTVRVVLPVRFEAGGGFLDES